MPAHPPHGDDDWYYRLRPQDVLRLMAAWDRVLLHVPAESRRGARLVSYLHQHTGLPRHLLTDLRETRNACAHPFAPRSGPRAQADIDRALVTAYHALARLRCNHSPGPAVA
ncbi:hypothetical protein GCM10009530_59950 [Microbispora corallina]|uniref:Uncharacterized protein n=1 Tax=Microbispora corallina TaxID=83302 RepID=A0ABQ4GA58_9ACTN|nr:hypothetical protein [Microbispora corallina]GIH43930.1 hypothetical protein Mco01_69300 [Microbispora corallina]